MSGSKAMATSSSRSEAAEPMPSTSGTAGAASQTRRRRRASGSITKSRRFMSISLGHLASSSLARLFEKLSETSRGGERFLEGWVVPAPVQLPHAHLRLEVLHQAGEHAREGEDRPYARPFQAVLLVDQLPQRRDVSAQEVARADAALARHPDEPVLEVGCRLREGAAAAHDVVADDRDDVGKLLADGVAGALAEGQVAVAGVDGLQEPGRLRHRFLKLPFAGAQGAALLVLGRRDAVAQGGLERADDAGGEELVLGDVVADPHLHSGHGDALLAGAGDDDDARGRRQGAQALDPPQGGSFRAVVAGGVAG